MHFKSYTTQLKMIIFLIFYFKYVRSLYINDISIVNIYYFVILFCNLTFNVLNVPLNTSRCFKMHELVVKDKSTKFLRSEEKVVFNTKVRKC